MVSVHDYLPQKYDLFTNLGALDKIVLNPLESEQRNDVQRLLEQLPFYLRGACESFDRLLFFREQAALQFRENTNANARWLITGDLADSMTFAVEACLMYLRRSADAILHYVNRCPRNFQLPSSINDVVKKFRKGVTNGCDTEIVRLLMAYWDSVGAKVKGYRDQAAHFAIGASDGLMYFHPLTRGVGLRLMLPDDPFATSVKKMTYSPGIQTVSFLNVAIYETVRYFNAVIERLIDLSAPGDADVRNTGVVHIALRGGGTLSADENVSLGEPVPFSVSSVITARRAAGDLDKP